MGAINSKDWDSAKSFCVYETDAYSTISFLEKLINDMHYLYSKVKIYFIFNHISNVSIDGNDAKAYVYVTMVTICDEKIGTDWKIYHWK